MSSGLGFNISLKPSRLTKLLETNTNNHTEEMANKKAAAKNTAAATSAAAATGEAAAPPAAAAPQTAAAPPAVAAPSAAAATSAAMETMETGGGSPPFITVTKKKANQANQANSQDIRNFLQAAATPAKRVREVDNTSPRDQQAAKKPAQNEEEDEEEGGDIIEAMRRKIMEKAGLSPQQVEAVMEVVIEGVKELLQKATKEVAASAAKEATKAAADAANRRWEADRCRRSILIHNADRWVGDADNGYGLAENITAQIHRCMAHTVLVMDAFTIGQWVNNKPPSSVFVTFGSVAQKATFFRVLARCIQEKKPGYEQLRGISCRDAFPKEFVLESKRLAQKGFVLRQNGQVAAFRVVARGPACIPVLEVRARLQGNARGRWEIFKSQERPQPVVPMPGTAAATTPPTGSGRGEARRDTPRKSLANDDIVPLGIDDEELYMEDF